MQQCCVDRVVEEALIMLYEVARGAIKSGDWEVDGACDPDQAMNRAEQVLIKRGWLLDENGEWVLPDDY